ncbi:MAG: Type 1 glutamine amidotransferase-like domain-containing protein [Patescibacteria group bacterium]
MTTYLLHGGGTSKDLAGNDLFFSQFTKLVDKPEVKVLLCYWSRNQHEWQTLIERDQSRILKNSDKKVSFQVAENSKDLFEKPRDSDVLYVAGGDAELLEPYYSELSNLRSSLNGKIYAGSSMGAFLASNQYVLPFDSQDDESVHAGVGLLPIQVLCHWNVEKKKDFKLNLLSNSKPIITLNEGEFVEIYQ